MTINERKQALRKQVAALKRAHSPEVLAERSREALRRLESTALFQAAGCVALYHALPGEVQTADCLTRWYGRKQLLLPVVQGDDLILRPYAGPESLRQGAYDIWEPALSDASDDSAKPDLIVVPGIAFDRQLNRLGRGRGYYDRLLSDLSLPCVGLAFAFQLFDAVPVDAHDRRMTAVVTDEEVVE